MLLCQQSGIVTSKVQELQDCIQWHREELITWGLNPQAWTSWLLPFTGPLLRLFLLITLGSCILTGLVCFIRETVYQHMNAHILALQGYQPLEINDDLQGIPIDHQEGGHEAESPKWPPH